MKSLGVVILYANSLIKDASTIDEYIDSFSNYGEFAYTKLNTISGFDETLSMYHIDALILHYSLFGSKHYMLTPKYLDFIEHFKKPKIAIFQDEGYYCQKRFDFINKAKLDLIVTLMSEKDNELFYKKYTTVKHFIYAIPGYEMIILCN